jgi:hypothetical protein
MGSCWSWFFKPSKSTRCKHHIVDSRFVPENIDSEEGTFCSFVRSDPDYWCVFGAIVDADRKIVHGGYLNSLGDSGGTVDPREIGSLCNMKFPYNVKATHFHASVLDERDLRDFYAKFSGISSFERSFIHYRSQNSQSFVHDRWSI